MKCRKGNKPSAVAPLQCGACDANHADYHALSVFNSDGSIYDNPNLFICWEVLSGASTYIILR